MKSYNATEDDMREYSRIISAITQLDIQRNEYVQMLSDWEQAHAVSEPSEETVSLDEN